MATTLMAVEIDNEKYHNLPKGYSIPDDWIDPAITPDYIYVGMPCTRQSGSDRHGGYVCEIHRNGKKLYVGRYNWTTPGITEEEYEALDREAQYPYRMEEGRQVYDVYTLRKNGRFVRQDCGLRSSQFLVLGVKEDYIDPSF